MKTMFKTCFKVADSKSKNKVLHSLNNACGIQTTVEEQIRQCLFMCLQDFNKFENMKACRKLYLSSFALLMLLTKQRLIKLLQAESTIFLALLQNMSYDASGPRKFRSWQIDEETAQAILENANIHRKIYLLHISFSEASGS